MADKQYLLNSWLVVFSPTVQGCLKNDYTEFDFDKWENWCQKSANAGANGIRILPYSPWSQEGGGVPIEKLWSPYILENGKWNLNKYNDKYFEILSQMVAVAAKYNLKIWYSLFDNAQFHHGSTEVSPWGNNVQGFDDYYDSLPYALKWTDKVFSVLGRKVFYEIINEGVKRNLPIKAAAEWNVEIFDRLLSKGVIEEEICWGASSAATYENGVWEEDRNNSLQTIILSTVKFRPGKIQSYRSMHNVGVYNEVKDGEIFPASYHGEWALNWWGGSHTGKGFLSDDGVANGASDNDIKPNGKYRRPSPEQWYNVAKLILKNDANKINKWVIERLPSNMNPDVWVPTMEAISKAYFEKYGVWPENYGKFPYIAECQTGEVKKSICWDGSEIITHTCVENKWVETGNTCPEQPEPPDQKCSCFHYLNIKDFLFGVPNFIKCLFGKLEPYCKEK
ncbi:MAG: hypothetical protein WC495_06385 [Patescibacteria group bacterium]|jgi:hypothetical protein